MTSSPATDLPSDANPSAALPPPAVPDHELIRRIGRGAYGEVWLARSVTGAYRAVKIVHRASFDHDRPFEREFEGIQKFEPISRRHDSQVDILHVGRNGDCFYYVMELADDQTTGGQIPDPDLYKPRTLKSDLLFRSRLPFEECVSVAIALTTALEHLHGHGLVHRDVKPSNIIFVNGVAKLADIGLVTGIDATRSYVGTEGFAAPEGPGTAQADLFSLGKVLYEMATGKDRQEFPELPTLLRELPDREGLMELNAVIARACRHDPKDRYSSAAAMRGDLELLQGGKSLARLHRLQSQLRFVRRTGALVTALAAVIALGWWWQARQTAKVRDLATQNLNLALRADTSATAAQKSEATARESLYAADIQLAQQALKADNLRLARSLLQNHVPKPGQPDLRGFEWRYLWQQCQSEELFSLPGITNSARVLAFSPDDRLIAVGAIDGNSALFDLTRRQKAATLPGTNPVLSVVFSPRGEWLVTASTNHVSLWDARTFAPVRRLPDAVAPARFSPDGKFLLTCRRLASTKTQAPQEQPHDLVLWDTINWSVRSSVSLPPSGGFSIPRDVYMQPLFLPDGRRVVVLAGETIRLFSLPDLRELRTLKVKVPTTLYSRPFIALSPDGRTLAMTSTNGFALRLWDLEGDQLIRELSGHTDTLFGAAFSPDGTMLATCSPDQTIRLWKVETGEWLKTFRGQADEVFDVEFSADGKRLASLGAYDAVVKLWDPYILPRRDTLRHPLNGVGFDADGNLVAYLWPWARPVELDSAALQHADSSVAFHVAHVGVPQFQGSASDSLTLRSVSSDGRFQGLFRTEAGAGLEIWDRRARARLGAVPSDSPLMSFGPRRQLVATYVRQPDGLQRSTVWQLPDGTPKWVFTNDAGFLQNRTITPDENHLLSYQDQAVTLWRIDGDGIKQVLRLPSQTTVTDVALAPDGGILAVAEGDLITLRAVPSGEVIGELHGHTRKTVVLAFSPDGRTLASMADDRSVRLWHVATLRQLLHFQSAEEDYDTFELEFSPDGRALAASRRDRVGSITWLHFAPSLAEIAAAEGEDYAPLVGQDPLKWFGVSKMLLQRGRPNEALPACTQTLQLVGARKELEWLRDKALRHRADVLRELGRNEEAGADNLSLLGLPARDPATPAGALDLSAYYNAPVAWDTNAEGGANDLSELPIGPQVFAGTVFDVRGDIGLSIRSTEREWPIEVTQVNGIRIQRRLTRLHFLQAAGAESRTTKTGDQIGHYRIHFADGRDVVLPIRYNVDTSDYWELDHLPREVPEATLAWRGQNPRSRADGKFIRLFKRTWQNPYPDVEVTRLDFVAEHPRTHPMLIALTAE